MTLLTTTVVYNVLLLLMAIMSPFAIKLAGLPHTNMRPPNDHEWDTLPHPFLASNDVWNPSCNNDELSIADLLLDAPPA
jgi:hypothetical protein